jgi:hypothetical protein
VEEVIRQLFGERQEDYRAATFAAAEAAKAT